MFREAIAAIDSGDVARLQHLLAENTQLVQERFDEPAEGYFAHPYLLWFVAGNPVRNERLPENIVEITRTLIDAGANQLDYTLALVSSGRVPRESGVQIALIDLLVERGANPEAAVMPALVHQEIDAVRRLLHHGATLTLVAAICLGRTEDAMRLLETASADERQIALTAAAFYGRPEHLRMLIDAGADVSARSPAAFHPHATPLRQPVYSGSLDAVKVLVQAGADLRMTDHVHHGTPLEWAEYCRKPEIAAYLRAC
jgi:hypothetical protein